MLVEKIILCILTFAALFVASLLYERNFTPTFLSSIIAFVAAVLGIAFCVLLIRTNWNLFTIPKILLFISVCIYVVLPEYCGKPCIPFWIGIVITVIAFVIAGILYIRNVEEITTDLSTTTATVICAKDNPSIAMSIY